MQGKMNRRQKAKGKIKEEVQKKKRTELDILIHCEKFVWLLADTTRFEFKNYSNLLIDAFCVDLEHAGWSVQKTILCFLFVDKLSGRKNGEK